MQFWSSEWYSVSLAQQATHSSALYTFYAKWMSCAFAWYMFASQDNWAACQWCKTCCTLTSPLSTCLHALWAIQQFKEMFAGSQVTTRLLCLHLSRNFHWSELPCGYKTGGIYLQITASIAQNYLVETSRFCIFRSIFCGLSSDMYIALVA